VTKEHVRVDITATDKRLMPTVMVNFWSQLQERTVRQEDHLKIKTYIKWHFTADTQYFFYIQPDLSKQLSENRHIPLPHPV
jgi:hypothetical protein